MYQRILVPVDGSLTSERGLDEAIRLARLTHASLRLIHIIDEQSVAFAADSYANLSSDLREQLREEGEALLEKCKAKVRATGLVVDAVLYDNLQSAVHELVAREVQFWNADLIVLGTHGRRGFKRMMVGSGAENILRHSPVPVLLVRSPAPALAADRDPDESGKA